MTAKEKAISMVEEFEGQYYNPNSAGSHNTITAMKFAACIVQEVLPYGSIEYRFWGEVDKELDLLY